jgi:hypothetical protein
MDINQFKPVLDAYEKMWRIYGKKICEKISENLPKKKKIEDDGKTMREFIKAYNENKESDPQHFVVIVESRGR